MMESVATKSTTINFWEYVHPKEVIADGKPVGSKRKLGEEGKEVICCCNYCDLKISTPYKGDHSKVSRIREHFNVNADGKYLGQEVNRIKECRLNPFKPVRKQEKIASHLPPPIPRDSESSSQSTLSSSKSGISPYYSLPSQLRLACRSEEFQEQTSGQASGFAQANLCILPKKYAFDFLLFCQRNPKPCPLLHVLEAGEYQFNDVDIRTDLPKYRVYEDGVLVKECANVKEIWSEDFVTFVIGCSFSFEDALVRGGLSIRHIDQKRNVPMYRTNVSCRSAGVFHGDLVVSMRPFKPSEVAKAVEITARYPRVHGAPVHIGNPEALGIADINRPDYGDAVDIYEGEIPVFWACGVTPQSVVMSSRPSICITHAPGHMLVLDQLNEELSLS